MTTDIIPLGTAAAVPTPDRHLSAVAIERKGRVLLFDCGEGTQVRFLDVGLNRARVDAIFVTHLHGDHWFGLPGLLSTMALLQRTDPVTVVGPVGLHDRLDALAEIRSLPYPLRTVALPPDVPVDDVYVTDDFAVDACPLQHRVPAHGFRLQEHSRRGRFQPERARALGVTDPNDFGRLAEGTSVTTEDGTIVPPNQVLGPEREGLAVAYVTDTEPCNGGRALAHEADLLYHEATFLREHVARARTTGHSTAREAATIARNAHCQRLLLGHISARYATVGPLVEEAQAVFPNSDAAREGHRYTLDPREKWDETG